MQTLFCLHIIAPPLTLVFSTSGPPNEGQSYSLTCDLMGDESLAVSATSIRWDRLTPNFMMAVHRGATLSFTSLSRDDEGQYMCTTNIMSPYTTSSQTEMETTSFTVIRKKFTPPNLYMCCMPSFLSTYRPMPIARPSQWCC